MFTDAVGQIMGSKTAVTHKDDLAVRKYTLSVWPSL